LDEEERFILKANPKKFINSYCNVKTKEAAAGRTGTSQDSDNDEEDDNPLNEEETCFLAKTRYKSDDGELKPASRPVASNDGGLTHAASNDGGDLAAATNAPEEDGSTVENNSASKILFPIDLAGAANNTSRTNIVRTLMSVDEG
jgi:hypothetical protein